MPFEPRLVSPDDEHWAEDAELDLPPDLEALTEQLRADAVMLAEHYPTQRSETDAFAVRLAGSGRLDVGRPNARRFVWWSAIAVAAATVLVAAAGWGIWQLASPVGGDTPQAAGKVDSGRGGRGLDLASASVDTAAGESENARGAVPGSAAETMLIHVSGPELEAVLDLMETQGTDDSLLSI
jgi:hypothetical protein